MRIRTIKPDFFADESMGAMSRDARLLALGSLVLADDEGLLRWTPEYVRASLFMYDADMKGGHIARIMGELAESEYVLPYAGGKTHSPMAWIVKFRKHQRINRPQEGKLPAPSLQNRDVQMAYCRRDGWVCGICGGPISSEPREWHTKSHPSLDHIVPRSEGGLDYPTNIRIAHFSCNASRGARDVNHSVSEYVQRAVNPSGIRALPEVEVEVEQGSGMDAKHSPSASVENRGQVPDRWPQMLEKLSDTDPRWLKVTIGALVKLAKETDSEAVSSALGFARLNPPDIQSSPFGWLRTTARSVHGSRATA